MHELPPIRMYRKNLDRSFYRINRFLFRALKVACSGVVPWPLTLMSGKGVGKTCACLFYCDVTRGSLYATHRSFTSDLHLVRTGGLADPVTGKRITEEQFWKRVVDFRLVVIDDVLMGKAATPLAVDTLMQIIRYRTFKPLILITSLRPSEIRREFGDNVLAALCEGTPVVVSEQTYHPGKTVNKNEKT